MTTFPATLVDIEAQLATLVFLSIRASAAMMVAPVIGGVSVPVSLRVLLGLAIGVLALSFELPAAPPERLLSLAAMVALAQEVAIGLALGFVIQIGFSAAVIAAEQISGTMGLAIATSIDPSSGAQSGALGSYFSLVMTLLFFGLGAHLAWFELLVESYRVLPPFTSALGSESARALVLFMGQTIALGAAIALPVVLVLLLVQMVTGVLSRSAPALNLFALGLPAGVLAGLAALIAVLPIVFEQFETVIATTLDFAAEEIAR